MADSFDVKAEVALKAAFHFTNAVIIVLQAKGLLQKNEVDAILVAAKASIPADDPDSDQIAKTLDYMLSIKPAR